MNLDVVSLLKNKPLIKSITWESSPETILMQEDFLDSNMANNTINSRDNGGTTLEINSIEIKVDHPQGHNNKGLVSMIAQRSWKRL
ncbi:hypothetical protein DD573_29975 [Klebsiella pneumoniae]|nr:hypothetical protein DD573_29975 [Klebsiella pneumoniae]